MIAFYTILTFPALSCKPDLLTARSPYFSPIQFPIIPPQQQQIEFPTALPSSAPPYAPALAVALEVAFASSLLHKIFVESNIEKTIFGVLNFESTLNVYTSYYVPEYCLLPEAIGCEVYTV